MRSAIIAAAAFAATAVAVPYNKPRDVVTDTKVNMVYVTEFVTVTGERPAPTEEAAPTQESVNKQHYGHPKKPKWWGRPHGHKTKQPAPTEEPAPTYSEPAGTWSEPAQAPTSTWSEPASEPPRSAPAAAPTDYASKCVLHHNIHRANHSAPDIAWDSNLEASAKQVADSCKYEHNVDAMGGGYGQNIAAGVAPDNITAIITNLFYNGEVNYYDGQYGKAQPDMSEFEKWGHFSQIVWKGTTHVGCYTKDCSATGLQNTGGNVSPFFTVCNYKSPGNFANQYGSNVGQPLGHPTADWNYGL